METRLTRQELAKKWNCSTWKVDRLRDQGLLPWVDLTGGLGKRPVVRFRLEDIEKFEEQYLMNINKEAA